MNLEYSHFNALDMLIVGMIFFSILVSCTRGFVSEFLGLGSWVAAGYLALEHHKMPEAFWSQWVTDKTILDILGYVTVGLISLIVFLLISQLLSHMIKGSMIGSVDRSLGCVFGIFRGCGLVLAFYVASLFFVLRNDQPALFKTSKSRPILDRGAILVGKFLPSDLKEKGLFLKNLNDLSQNHGDVSATSE